jgi:hypothetical protein
VPEKRVFKRARTAEEARLDEVREEGCVGSNGGRVPSPAETAEDHCPPAVPVCRTLSSQTESKPFSAKPSNFVSSISASVTRFPVSRERWFSQTRMLIRTAKDSPASPSLP